MSYRIFIISLLTSFLFTINESKAQKDTSSTSNYSSSEQYIPQSKYRKLRLGVCGGIGSSWMKPKTNNYESEGIKSSYSYGLLIDYNFTENYTFSSGISMSSMGGKLSFEDTILNVTPNTSGIITRSYRINYLEVPTLLKLKTNQIGYFTYFAQLGFNNGFRLSSFADDEYEFGPSEDSQTAIQEDIELNNETSFYRISFNFSLGAEYAISQTFSAYGSIGFDNGLLNSLSSENDITGKAETAFIKRFGIVVGFMF